MRCSPRPSSAGPPRERRRNARAPARSAPGRGLRAPLGLETTHRAALAPTRHDDALARAGRFFAELEEAWRCRVGSVLEIAWPVYGPEHGGPLLDAVAGTPLPELPLR